LIIKKCITVLDKNSDSVSYLTGKSGIFITAADIYRDLGDIENAKTKKKWLKSIYHIISLFYDLTLLKNINFWFFLWYRVLDLLPLALNKKLHDILLYRQVGYLYSLLLLKKLGWEDPDRDRLLQK